jgi:hypothetical protein
MSVQLKRSLAALILSAMTAVGWCAQVQAADYAASVPAAPAGTHRYLENVPGEASDAEAAQRRAGHLSSAERKLLRQHVEDAAREDYKR